MTAKNLTEFTSLYKPREKLSASSLTTSVQNKLDRLSTHQGVAVFNGRSSAGKNLAAEAIATKLNSNVLRIDTISLLSKYIGETEKHIDALLNSAEKNQAVLFFDEADALVSKRTGVKDSHDRFANQEVSYLLKELERYEGLAILSTNLKADVARQLDKRLLLVSLGDDD